MKDDGKTREQLIDELAELRQREARLAAQVVEIKQTEEELRVLHHFLNIANQGKAMLPLLDEFVQEIQGITNCSAIGIRILDKEGNIPYMAYTGFSREFYESESPLSINSDQCMCINVVKGTTDPDLPFYTTNGSFYVNGTTDFLITVSGEEKDCIRDECNQAGYESVALVPIRLGERIFGVIHLADPRENVVPLEIVEMCERLGIGLAAAIEQVWVTETLRESEEKHRVLVENSGEAILVAQDGMFKFVNPRAMELTGYSDHELTSKGFLEFIHPDDREMVARRYLGRIKGERPPDTYTFRLVAKDGSLRWVQLNTTLMTWEGGPATLNFLTDVTDQKQAEEEQKETSSLLQNILDSSSSVSIISTDLKGNIVYWNVGAEKIFGYKAEEVVGFCNIGMLYPDDAEIKETLAEVKSRVFDNKEGMSCELRELTKDGKELWLHVNLTPRLDADGRVIGILGIGKDVTERKKIEEALAEERAMLVQRVEERTWELKIANMELARSDRLKDEFLANMSHELRTPLSGILGMSEVLQKNIHGTLGEKQSLYVKRIEESGRHLLDLINDILDIAKINSGKMDFEIRPASVESICQSSLRLLSQQAHKKHIDVSLKIDSASPMILADERRVKEILVNLLSNAVKFTPDGGAIGLEVTADPERKMVDLSVWDTGMGIPEEDMELIFQPFVQLDGSMSRQSAGTGLGLALVSRAAEAQDGSVSVESEVGKGSRFTVSLPQYETARIEEAASRAEPAQSMARVVEPDKMLETEQPLVLLAEDDAACADFISDILLSNGCRVIIARDGQEAIQQTKEQRPDIVLMDIQMPKVNGLDAIRHIRADTDVYSIPIIVLTSMAMRGDRERCLQTGADDYIAKPFGEEELIRIISAQLGQKAHA